MPGDLVPKDKSSAWEIWCLGDFVPIIIFCAQTIENDAISTNLRKLGCYGMSLPHLNGSIFSRLISKGDVIYFPESLKNVFSEVRKNRIPL